jgi:hypothetical protein
MKISFFIRALGLTAMVVGISAPVPICYMTEPEAPNSG